MKTSKLIFLIGLIAILSATSLAMAEETAIGDLNQQIDVIQQQMVTEEAVISSVDSVSAADLSQLIEAIHLQMERASQRHQTRVVQLEEMLEIAKDKGDEKAIERIYRLAENEYYRYECIIQALDERLAWALGF